MAESVSTRRYDMAAFIVPRHRSIMYKSRITKDKLLHFLDQALDKGANVVSIRLVEESWP